MLILLTFACCVGILLSFAHAPFVSFDSHDDMFLPVFSYLTMPAGHALFTQVVELRSSKTYDLKIWRYRTISSLRKARWKDISLVVGNVFVISM